MSILKLKLALFDVAVTAVSKELSTGRVSITALQLNWDEVLSKLKTFVAGVEESWKHFALMNH